eukprot:GHVT01041837.1.p1 GENE.GHVT01041837.1~~GHVT01041837.1.p1  ORF type:complete len:149 (-),score=2.19 GHVT01041837.1:750-1196(-)
MSFKLGWASKISTNRLAATRLSCICSSVGGDCFCGLRGQFFNSESGVLVYVIFPTSARCFPSSPNFITKEFKFCGTSVSVNSSTNFGSLITMMEFNDAISPVTLKGVSMPSLETILTVIPVFGGQMRAGHVCTKREPRASWFAYSISN